MTDVLVAAGKGVAGDLVAHRRADRVLHARQVTVLQGVEVVGDGIRRGARTSRAVDEEDGDRGDHDEDGEGRDDDQPAGPARCPRWVVRRRLLGRSVVVGSRLRFVRLRFEREVLRFGPGGPGGRAVAVAAEADRSRARAERRQAALPATIRRRGRLVGRRHVGRQRSGGGGVGSGGVYGAAGGGRYPRGAAGSCPGSYHDPDTVPPRTSGARRADRRNRSRAEPYGICAITVAHSSRC